MKTKKLRLQSMSLLLVVCLILSTFSFSLFSVLANEIETNGDSESQVTGNWEQSRLGEWRFFSNGVPVTGWHNDIPGWENWFYFNADGVLKTAWFTDNGTDWFYADPSTGVMYTQWINDGGSRWFYCADNGSMLTGWQWLEWGQGTSWFDFKSNGEMYANTVTPDGYTVDANGAYGTQAYPQEEEILSYTIGDESNEYILTGAESQDSEYSFDNGETQQQKQINEYIRSLKWDGTLNADKRVKSEKASKNPQQLQRYLDTASNVYKWLYVVKQKPEDSVLKSCPYYNANAVPGDLIRANADLLLTGNVERLSASVQSTETPVQVNGLTGLSESKGIWDKNSTTSFRDQKLQEWINAGQGNLTAANTSWKYSTMTITNEDELSAKLGASYESLLKNKISADVESVEKNKKSMVIARVQQVYYTINTQNGSRPTDFMNKNATLDEVKSLISDADGAKATYISQVDYGREVYICFTAECNNSQLKQAVELALKGGQLTAEEKTTMNSTLSKTSTTIASVGGSTEGMSKVSETVNTKAWDKLASALNYDNVMKNTSQDIGKGVPVAYHLKWLQYNAGVPSDTNRTDVTALCSADVSNIRRAVSEVPEATAETYEKSCWIVNTRRVRGNYIKEFDEDGNPIIGIYTITTHSQYSEKHSNVPPTLFNLEIMSDCVSLNNRWTYTRTVIDNLSSDHWFPIKSDGHIDFKSFYKFQMTDRYNELVEMKSAESGYDSVNYNPTYKGDGERKNYFKEGTLIIK